MNVSNRFTYGETMLVPTAGRGRMDPTVVLEAVQKEKVFGGWRPYKSHNDAYLVPDFDAV